MPSTPGSSHRKQIASQILSLVRGEKRDIWVIIIYALGIGICSLVVPIAIQSLVTSVAFGSVLQPLVVLTLVVAGVLTFSGVMRIFQLIAAEILQRRLVVRASLSVGQRLLSVSLREFSEQYGSEYVVRFMELFAIQKLITLILLDGTAFVFQIGIALVLVSFYHPLFLAFALCLLFCLLFLIFVLGIGGVRTSINESEAKYQIMEWLQALAKHPETFKSERGERFALSTLDDTVNAYLDERTSHFSVLLRQTLGAISLQAIANALLLGLGGWLVIKGQLTLGQLVAAELAFGFVLTNLTKLGRHLEKFYDLAASVSKLDSLFDLPYEPTGGSFFGVSPEPALLSVIDVTVQGESFAEPLLQNISFELLPGEKAVVWGPNASGKSLLADLLFRISQPTKGRVEIDHHPLSTIHPRELRNEVALVRGTELFAGTIEQNLVMGNPDVSPRDIQDALSLVGLRDEIYALREGLQTRITGLSTPLSSGQALRFMIARALLMKSRLLILDGTIDAMDDMSQELIVKMLNKSCPSTILLLTHDIKLERSLPKAYRIDRGTMTLISEGRS